ncbi:MAG: AbrB/MazE/SpoVT family DNA-binding domain-containing protein [Anaerolineae bacterium]
MGTNVATMTAKGQVTIPKAIRQALGIRERDHLLFLIEGGRLVLIPLRYRPLPELYGTFPATRPYLGHQAVREEIRSELGERISH